MTALVSLLFITMIPIDCKITKFSLYLYYRLSKSILFELAVYPLPVLKPGRVTWVIRVTFCTGHPGQTQFKNYLGLTRIGSCEPRN